MRKFRLTARWQDSVIASRAGPRLEVTQESFEWAVEGEATVEDLARGIADALTAGTWIYAPLGDGREILISPDRLKGAVITIEEVVDAPGS